MSLGVTRILVVEDHPIFLKGLIGLLSLEPEFQVVAEALDRQQALEALDAAAPDLALVDLSLGEDNGLDLIKDIQFRSPRTRILVLSMFEEPAYRERSMAAGALGFCRKGESVEILFNAIRTVAAGHRWQGPRGTPEDGEAGLPDTMSAALKTLTDREFEVFGLIGKGFGTGEIAAKLHISIKTVDTYKGNLKGKLGCASALELRRTAVSWQARQNRL